MPIDKPAGPGSGRLEDEIPKNDRRTVFWLVLGAFAVGMLVLMILGFVDASIISDDETEGPAPEVVVPGTLPD